MATTAINAVQGPADLWVAAFGTAEPAATAVGIAAAPATGWASAGGTLEGVTIKIEQEYAKLRFDQVVDNVGARLTSRVLTVETQLAEATLENLAIALNAGTVGTGVTGIKTLAPVSGLAATQPSYRALIIDGWAPEEPAGVPQRRRIVVRKVLSTEGVEFAYTLEDQTVYNVTFEAFYVSDSILPFQFIDADPV